MLIIDAEFTEIKSFDEKLADFLKQPHYAIDPIPVRKTKVGQRKRTKKKRKYNFRVLKIGRNFGLKFVLLFSFF